MHKFAGNGDCVCGDAVDDAGDGDAGLAINTYGCRYSIHCCYRADNIHTKSQVHQAEIHAYGLCAWDFVLHYP